SHVEFTGYAVWRSRDFLVQGVKEPAGIIRLSICRTNLDRKGDWTDGITWDQLQRLKSEAGFGDLDAVEVYPAASDVVNVANLRHLWVFPAPLPFAWRNNRALSPSLSLLTPAAGTC